MSHRDDVKAFLSSRRAKSTPVQAGLPTYGRARRVPGLRRGEVADRFADPGIGRPVANSQVVLTASDVTHESAGLAGENVSHRAGRPSVVVSEPALG